MARHVVLFRWVSGILLLLATALATSPARAQEPTDAQAIFKAGLDEMMAGKFETGCPKIAEAYRLTKGAGALFTLAECQTKWGKNAAALAHYREYLALFAQLDADARVKQEERAKLATTQVAALSALVPTLTIAGVDDLGVEVVVTLDGKELPRDTLGQSIELEIGTYELVATAPDGRTAQESIELGQGARRTWRITLPAQTTGPDEPPPGDDLTGAQIAGVVVGGVGVALLVVGAITGGLAIGQRTIVDERCVDLACDAEGLAAVDQGKTFGDASTATLAIGGAALIAGVLLVILGADGPEADASSAVTVTANGLSWSF